MPKKFIKRFMPEHKVIREHKHLRIFGSLLHDPNLFHLNRRSVAGAFAVGLFCAWVPTPFQMVLAAALAIPLRVNLPISVALVWISNPLTMPPLFYFAYTLGTWILGIPERNFHFEMSFEWLGSGLEAIWQPFLLGCLVMGISSSLLGYLGMRLLWRISIIRKIRKKNLRHYKPPQA
jgi:uncharacterized protein (DUF2062 family)